MKLLIIGASGVIGSKFNSYFSLKEFETTSTYFNHKLTLKNSISLNIENELEVEKIFSKFRPDIVIHAAAITNIDLCETDKKLADKINVDGTKNILNFSKKNNSKLVYISTSFVFDGLQKKYFEDDQTNPTTYYGITKEKSEKNIINSGIDFLILRTDQPYCWIKPWQHHNSVTRVLENLQAKKIHNEITDWYNTPTYVPDLVKSTEQLLINNKKGIYHVVGSDFINRYEWSILIANYFNLDSNLIKPIKSEQLKLSAKRVNVNLCNDKVFNELGIRMMGIKTGLKQMINDRNE